MFSPKGTTKEITEKHILKKSLKESKCYTREQLLHAMGSGKGRIHKQEQKT